MRSDRPGRFFIRSHSGNRGRRRPRGAPSLLSLFSEKKLHLPQRHTNFPKTKKKHFQGFLPLARKSFIASTAMLEYTPTVATGGAHTSPKTASACRGMENCFPPSVEELYWNLLGARQTDEDTKEKTTPRASGWWGSGKWLSRTLRAALYIPLVERAARGRAFHPIVPSS